MTYTWVYSRGQDRLEVRRSTHTAAIRFEVVDGHAGPRAFDFDDHAAFVTFDLGFEHALMQSGWSFAEFRPERRSGDERRTVLRAGDRRRSIALAWSRSQPVIDQPQNP